MTTKRRFRTVLVALLTSFSITALPQTLSVAHGNHASALLEAHREPLHSGSEVAFQMKLDTPLPEGAHFDVRLSPLLVDQELAVSSGEPLNRERTEFLLRTKLPEKAIPGEWHVKVTYLFLAGTSWTYNTLSTNDLRFSVEGPKVEIPTKATATLLTEKRDR